MTMQQLLRTGVVAGCALALSPGSLWADDDAYVFADVAVEVALTRTETGARLSWPEPTPTGWDTALLGLRVDARGVQAPWLEVGVEVSRISQHLDAGASGLRWVNLSRLKGSIGEGAAIEIVGHGVTLTGERGELRLFATPEPEGPTLILAPHPDDAEIAAFGLYDGSDATIVTITSGNAGDFNYRREVSDPAEHYLFKGFLRSVDSVTVPWLGGIPPDRTYNLGYFDARLRDMHGGPDQTFPELYGPNDDVSVYRRANVGSLLPKASRANSWTHLVEDLASILEKVRPGRIVMPYPQLDDHADHQYTTVAAIEALEGWSRPIQVLLYTNHASRNRYPFGPAGTATSLPPWSESALQVQGVYSHELDAEVQRRKLYALEAMHDLRLSPGEQDACATPGALRPRDDYPRNEEVDYFRRAVRPDEVFFRYDLDGARDVVASFLEPAPEAAEWPDPERFEGAIAAFEAEDATAPPPAGAIVAVGSSSLRLWREQIGPDLSPLTIVPRGFGGSNMNDLLHYLDRAVLAYEPRAILLYEGDNDAAQGLSPASILDRFGELVHRTHAALPDTRIYVLAVKPSPARWELWPTMQETNRLLAEACREDERLRFIDVATPLLGEDGAPRPGLFVDDRLHLNRQGYELWRDRIRPVLLETEGPAEASP